MSAIQWIVFLAYLAAPSQPKEVLYSTEYYDSYYNDYNTNDAFVTRRKAQDQNLEQEIGSLKAQNQNLQQDMDAIRSQLAALNQAQSQISTYKQEMMIHEECTKYKTLNYTGRAPSNRASKYLGRGYKVDCDSCSNGNPDWKGSNQRYRFTGPFTRMAVKGEVTSQFQCGAYAPCYIEDPKVHDNLKIGEMKDYVRVCCVSKKTLWSGGRSNNIPCYSSFSITITRCPGDYFVYRLYNMGNSFVACGSK